VADVLVLYNPLDVSRRRRYQLEAGTPLLAWLDEREPQALESTRTVFVNTRCCADAAYRTQVGDEVLVTFTPGSDPITATEVLQAVLKAVIAVAIGSALQHLFGIAKPQAGNTPNPSQVYGIAPPKNVARLGQPIPVLYGSVVALPDFAAQPYTFFLGNEQYLHALLCIGLGDNFVDPHGLLLGDTAASSLAPGVVTFQVFEPWQHAQTFGVIERICGVRENVVTSPAVGDQELVAPNMGGTLVPSSFYWLASNFSSSLSQPTGTDMTLATSPAQQCALLPVAPTLGTVVSCYSGGRGASGGLYQTWIYTALAYDQAQSLPAGALVPPPHYDQAGVTKWVGSFQTCKAGQHGSLLELDFVFPGGLYSSDSSGNLQNASVVVSIFAQAIDSAGNDTTDPPFSVSETFQAKDNTPQRLTKSYPVPSARYRVQVARTSASDGKTSTSDHVTWAGLKFQLDPPPAGTTVYGNVTLVALQLKATNGVASDAASSLRFRCIRMLSPLGVGATAATVNPADAFVDVMTAAYGGARPLNGDELDLPALSQWRSAWSSHNGFNAIFDQPSTVWEALGLTVQTVHAAPLPIGSRMSLIHDGVQPVRSQLFTDANIAAGSLTVTCAFDTVGTPAGVRINYRDPVTFSDAALLVPLDAPDFTTLDLFGCTDVGVAQEHASLIAAKRAKQRTTIQFDTELEGLNVLPGDRIGVQAGLVKWAQVARVDAVVGTTLTLDRALAWTAGATHAVQLRDPQGVPWRVVGVTRGVDDWHLVLPALPAWPLTGAGANQEATALSFGVQDAEVTDWTVAKITPNANKVTLEGANYDASIYAGAAAFTRGEGGLA
jgi:hypothetical protein